MTISLLELRAQASRRFLVALTAYERDCSVTLTFLTTLRELLTIILHAKDRLSSLLGWFWVVLG